MVQESNSYFIYFAVFVSNLVTFEVGTSVSWTSPVLPKFQSRNTTINPLSTPISTMEESLLVSIALLSALLTTIVAGLICDKLGKKLSLMIISLPLIASHVLCLFASNIYMFIAARFLIGVTGGGVYAILPSYLSEIAEVNKRGMVGSMFGVAQVAGVNFVYIVGPLMSIKMFSFVNLLISLLYIVLFMWQVPDSPQDLVRRGQSEYALKALTKLRRKPAHHLVEEFSIINESNAPSDNWRVILEHRSLKQGFIISIILIFMQQFTGIFAISSYLQSILQMSDTIISPVYSSMLTSIFQMLVTLVSSVLIDRAGRRPLLITSSIGCIISLVTLAGYLYLTPASYSWLPLACLFVYFLTYSLGLSNLPWIMPTEMFPANVSAIILSITCLINLCLAFIVMLFFPVMCAWIGMAGCFFVLTAVLSVGLVFVVTMIPETKGKSFREIQKLLEE